MIAAALLVSALSQNENESHSSRHGQCNPPMRLELSSDATPSRVASQMQGYLDDEYKRLFSNLPIDFVPDRMQILPALLAEIFVGARLFIHDAHTTTMLPDLTGVALNEHTPNVIRQHVG